MRQVGNLFAAIPPSLPAELVETLASSAAVRVERIVSRGHARDDGFWYDQARDEFVLLVAGAARLRFEGDEPVELRAGDYLTIPAHRRHRVEWTTPDGPTVWLAVHYEG